MNQNNILSYQMIDNFINQIFGQTDEREKLQAFAARILLEQQKLNSPCLTNKFGKEHAETSYVSPEYNPLPTNRLGVGLTPSSISQHCPCCIRYGNPGYATAKAEANAAYCDRLYKEFNKSNEERLDNILEINHKSLPSS